MSKKGINKGDLDKILKINSEKKSKNGDHGKEIWKKKRKSKKGKKLN